MLGPDRTMDRTNPCGSRPWSLARVWANHSKLDPPDPDRANPWTGETRGPAGFGPNCLVNTTLDHGRGLIKDLQNDYKKERTHFIMLSHNA